MGETFLSVLGVGGGGGGGVGGIKLLRVLYVNNLYKFVCLDYNIQVIINGLRKTFPHLQLPTLIHSLLSFFFDCMSNMF